MMKKRRGREVNNYGNVDINSIIINIIYINNIYNNNGYLYKEKGSEYTS